MESPQHGVETKDRHMGTSPAIIETNGSPELREVSQVSNGLRNRALLSQGVNGGGRIGGRKAVVKLHHDSKVILDGRAAEKETGVEM